MDPRKGYENLPLRLQVRVLLRPGAHLLATQINYRGAAVEVSK